jgi:hypothetical protein
LWYEVCGNQRRNDSANMLILRDIHAILERLANRHKSTVKPHNPVGFGDNWVCHLHKPGSGDKNICRTKRLKYSALAIVRGQPEDAP